jgi:hypothetical protein
MADIDSAVEALACPCCGALVLVSAEDGDAALSEMLHHLERRHTDHDQEAALCLLAQVKTVPVPWP